MNEKQLLTFYGLKFHPFLPKLPIEELWSPPDYELFFSRVEKMLPIGGFALLSGETGLGKSKLLHLLASRLERLNDVVVGVIERPQSSLADFYRELGKLFAVSLSPANRYGGFQTLRTRWWEHIKATLYRPVLLIDEGQELHNVCLNELRMLGSANFDSQCLLTTVLAGDPRLPERFRSRDLMALGGRIRIRKILEPYDSETLLSFLNHLLESAGTPQLMSATLKQVLCEHAAGNLRVLTNMGTELLEIGAERQLPSLDEKLFLEIFSPQAKPRHRSGPKSTNPR